MCGAGKAEEVLSGGCMGMALGTLSAPTTRMRVAPSLGLSPLARPKMTMAMRTKPSITASAG